MATTAPAQHQFSAVHSRHGGAAVDVALVAVPLLAVLFNSQIASATVLIVFASLAAMIWLRLDRLPVTIARAWPVLLIPAFALLSTLWSDLPSATVRYGFLYLITIALGICIGGMLERRALLIGLFAVFTFYNLAGFLFGGSVSVGVEQDSAFSGLAPSKNMAGNTAAVGLMLCLAVLSLAMQRRRMFLFVLALAMLPLSAWLLWSSLSTGALVSGTAAIFCLIVWLASQRMPVQFRGAVLATVGLALIAALLTRDIWLPALFDMVLSGSGKDAGLTGRVDLWRKADALIARQPWLGHGYAAFWIPGNLDAEAFWREFGIKARVGFNFHNTPREVLVSLGYVGAALLGTVVLVGTLISFVRTMVRPDPTRIFFCAWLVYTLIRAYFESLGVAQMNIDALLGSAALALAFVQKDTQPLLERPGAEAAVTRSAPA